MSSIYTELSLDNSDANQIRLVVLFPGELGSRIRCSRIVFSLDDRPQYEALSYTWGDESNPSVIEVYLSKPLPRTSSLSVHQIEASSSGSLQITNNLHTALQYLRYVDKERILWVDAICIDQTNNAEKSKQIPLMAKIYGIASNVLVWLGPADSATDKAFDLMDDMYRDHSKLLKSSAAYAQLAAVKSFRTMISLPLAKLQDTNPPSEDSSSGNYETMGTSYTRSTTKASDMVDMEEASAMELQNGNRSDPLSQKPSKRIFGMIIAPPTEEDWMALAGVLTARAYWKRLWIVQEVVYSRSATIVCGRRSIPWDIIQILQARFLGHERHTDFPDASECVSQVTDLVAPIDSLKWARQEHHEFWATKRNTLAFATYAFEDKLCKDPREKIFALLNLVVPESEMVADYTKTVSEVYLEATKIIILESSNLDVLCTSHDPEYRNSSRTDRRLDEIVPTWVPDWSSPPSSESMLRSNGLAPRYGAATRKIEILEQDLLPSIHPGVLSLVGVIYDTIVQTSEIANEETIWWLIIYIWPPLHAEIFGLDILRALPYGHTNESMLDAYWRTLIRETIHYNPTSRSRLGRLDIEQYREAFLLLCRFFGYDDDVTAEAIKERAALDSASRKKLEDLKFSIETSVKGWSFCITEKGYFALVEGPVETGDRICVVDGACVPLVLRYAGDTFQGKLAPADTAGFYTRVGTVHVHGIMDGEIGMQVDGGVVKKEKIFLR
ncbi:hypothetical protein MMC30_006735 [Trapelia coarctata]|nr:hypothetical protein [Trapelia coarctata]